MTPLRRITAAASALAVALGGAVAGAGAAGAQESPRKVVFASPPQGASPAEGQVVTDGRPIIEVLIPMGVIGPTSAQDVVLTVRSLDAGKSQPAQPRPKPVTAGGCQRVRFDDLVLPTNGRYELIVTTPGASEPILPPSGDCEGANVVPRRFFMGVRPATPTGVKAEVKPPAQLAVVSWEANPEPDVVRYRVLRAKGTDPKFELAGETARPSFTDVATTAGGEFSYRVIALRRGAKPGDPLLESQPSAPSGKVTVAATAAPSVAGPSAPSFAGPRVTGRPSSSPSPRYNTPGETGFSQTLPFDGTAQQVVEEPGDLAAVPVEELGTEEAQTDRKRSLALLAAGLLATVLAMHLLWVKSEVDREPLEVLSPE